MLIEAFKSTANGVPAHSAETLATAEPYGEDAETQAEWEHMARIRSETAKPVTYLPDDRL